jgi:uncharacterized protein YhbP (UPF0306 family)
MLDTAQTMPVEVIDHLRIHHIVTLGTTSFTGMPHAHTVAYANDDHRIYFIAIDDSQAARNISDNRYVSFTIDDYTTEWRKVRELQGVGRCDALRGDEVHVGIQRFADKFGARVALPQGRVFAVNPLEMHFVDYTYEPEETPPSPPRITPEVRTRLYLIDNEATRPSHAAVATDLNRRAFASGEVIFQPGDPAGQYYVVIEGEVEVRNEGFGADQTITRVGPGQMFGDQAALMGQRGILTAYAVAASVILAVERDAVRDLLLPRPGD